MVARREIYLSFEIGAGIKNNPTSVVNREQSKRGPILSAKTLQRVFGY